VEYILFSAFVTYFSILLTIGYLAYRKSKKTADYTLGNRSLSFWVTALAAHASDMSGWLFMGFPAAIYTRGLVEGWTAVGLTFFMFLNWRLVAPKLRVATAHLHCTTLSTFFEKRFNDTSGLLRIISALFCLLFFMFYISAGLVALGLLFESIFNINYLIGIMIGIITVFYTLLGGYLSISWIDFFQGLFLLVTIVIVPIVAFGHIDGFSSIVAAAQIKKVSLNFFPHVSWTSIQEIIFTAAGWGLGYFGQPHILTKFMGINDVNKMRNAQWVGIGWQIITLTAAVFVGLIGLAFFKEGLADNQLIFVAMVKTLFPSFVAGFILCAIIAAAINVMSAQVLVSASTIAEDFYKKSLTAHAPYTTKKIARISRYSVVVLCLLAGIVAFFSHSKTIYGLVLYAWTGLGCSFGPLLLVALHTKLMNKYAALAGILVGGTTAGLWPLINQTIPAMIVGFFASFIAMFFVNFTFSKIMLFSSKK
jgi:sodium/proline symporter